MANAFEALTSKVENTEKAHRVASTATVADGKVVVSLALTDIAQSRPSKGDKGALGFMFEPFEFTVDGHTFRINPGWATLSARR